jgi:hypothetical protein
MIIEFNLITGIMFGVEYVDSEDGEQHIVLDIAFLRILFSW